LEIKQDGAGRLGSAPGRLVQLVVPVTTLPLSVLTLVRWAEIAAEPFALLVILDRAIRDTGVAVVFEVAWFRAD
jgi:hypothetical protein